MKRSDIIIIIAVVLVIIYLLCMFCMFCMFLGYWIADVFFWLATL